MKFFYFFVFTFLHEFIYALILILGLAYIVDSSFDFYYDPMSLMYGMWLVVIFNFMVNFVIKLVHYDSNRDYFAVFKRKRGVLNE